MIKSKKEIENIQAACKITDTCFIYILPQIVPGVTEKEIAEKIETFIIKSGAELAFPVIVAFGKNTSFVHHLKVSKYVKCRRQEIVLLDFGAKVKGYCSDMTRMVFVGTPKKEWVFAYETVLQVQLAIINTIRSPIRSRMTKKIPFSGAKMDILARSLIAEAGLPPYPHGLGHNLGIEIHELPRLSRKKDAVITPGMVFTVEPGTYVKGQYGIRIEDTVCLNSNGLEILTKSPK
jgi:Xaa-Pro aminopeptidase